MLFNKNKSLQEQPLNYGYKRRIFKVAPWHGRSTYGGLKDGYWQSPSDLCTEDVAKQLLNKANKSFNEVNPVRNNAPLLPQGQRPSLRGRSPSWAEPGPAAKG